MFHADVVELVDTLVLGTSAARRVGSSPIIPTNKAIAQSGDFLISLGMTDSNFTPRVKAIIARRLSERKTSKFKFFLRIKTIRALLIVKVINY